MNKYEKFLLQEICEGDIARIKRAALIVLKENKIQKDSEFCTTLIKRMEAKTNSIQLPQKLKGMILVEEVSHYPQEKYYWRQTEEEICKKIISMYTVADKLQDIGIRYLPATILWGQSGCGKTELARYIAYKTNIPFVYVRFSAIISCYLG